MERSSRTAYYDVLEPSGNGTAPLCIEYGLVSCLQPRGAVGVDRKRFGRLVGVIPVSFG